MIISQAAAGISIYSYKCPGWVGSVAASRTVFISCAFRRRLDIVGRCCFRLLLSLTAQARRLKMGSRMLREEESSVGGGGDEEGSEAESTSEQNEPDLEVSVEDVNPVLPPAADMLKYLLSCLTAPAMSLCWGWKVQVSLLLEEGPPYMGNCLMGPVTFFSGSLSGLFCISSKAWMKWHLGP